jgi:hypothetical protein
MGSGHVFQAVMDWYKARELAPAFAYGYFGDRFILEAKPPTPVLNYALSVELDPDYFPSVHMMGAMYLDVGQTKKAADLFGKSIDLTKNPLLKNHLEHWIRVIESPGND